MVALINDLSVVNENIVFFLKDLEMELQWDLNRHNVEAGDDETPAESAQAPEADGELILAIQQELAPEGELTEDEYTRLCGKAEALYGAVAGMDGDVEGHALNKLA